MKKNNKTTSIGELLNKSVFGKANAEDRIQKAIKHSTIFSFWTNVVGAKFARYTKPTGIKYNKLYVSVKSSVIVQELNLYKTKLIGKINSYSMPLGIEIKDIVFNTKTYTATVPETIEYIEDKPVFFSDEKLKEVNLPIKSQESFKNSVNKINFLNQEQKEVLLNKLLNAKKAKIIQKEQP